MRRHQCWNDRGSRPYGGSPVSLLEARVGGERRVSEHEPDSGMVSQGIVDVSPVVLIEDGHLDIEARVVPLEARPRERDRARAVLRDLVNRVPEFVLSAPDDLVRPTAGVPDLGSGVW